MTFHSLYHRDKDFHLTFKFTNFDIYGDLARHCVNQKKISENKISPNDSTLIDGHFVLSEEEKISFDKQ